MCYNWYLAPWVSCTDCRYNKNELINSSANPIIGTPVL